MGNKIRRSWYCKNSVNISDVMPRLKVVHQKGHWNQFAETSHGSPEEHIKKGFYIHSQPLQF